MIHSNHIREALQQIVLSFGVLRFGCNINNLEGLLTTLFMSRQSQYKVIAAVNRTITKIYPCKEIQALASKFCVKT